MKRDRDKKRFVYKDRDPSKIIDRANRKGGGSFDNAFKPEYQVFSAKPGTSYCIRILPPTWEGAEHYGFEGFMHSQVGADGQKYWCLLKHGKGSCPLCEESDQLKVESHGNKDSVEGKASYSLKAKARCIMWIIDRDNEKAGPQIWNPSWIVDRELAASCVSKRTGEVMNIDNPDEAYDIEFEAIKDGQYTKLIGIKPVRQVTPLSDDEDKQGKWLAYIDKHPIPDTLLFYDEEHIVKVLSGGKSKAQEEDEDDGRKTRSERRHSRDDDEDESPRRRSLRDDDDEEDEDDEDERPRSKRRKIEDDDEELDEDDEEDEDDRRSSSKKTSRRDEDDEDEDDESEDDDEGPQVSRRSSASHHRRERDDDEPSSRRDRDRDDRDRRKSKVRSRSEDDEDEREEQLRKRNVLKKRRRDDDD